MYTACEENHHPRTHGDLNTVRKVLNFGLLTDPEVTNCILLLHGLDDYLTIRFNFTFPIQSNSPHLRYITEYTKGNYD